MKRLTVILLSVFLAGCSYLPFSQKEQNAAVKITNVDKDITTNETARLDYIAINSVGINHALQSETNSEANAAKTLNDLNLSVTGYTPTAKEVQDIYKLVDSLIESNAQTRVLLKQKTDEANALRQEETVLVNAKDKEIQNYMNVAKDTAAQADKEQSQLNEYQSYWGLGGIFLGIKSLVKHLLITLVVLLVVYILLRVLSSTNPLAAAIFGIFQSLGASAIHVIETIIPESISTLEDAKNDVQSVVDKISTPPKT